MALHKAFLDALGKKYIEKKDKGFYTISDEKDKKVAFVRDANNTYLSVASRHFGDSKARQVRTEEAIALAKQIGEN